MTRYSLICIAALSLVTTACSKTEAQEAHAGPPSEAALPGPVVTQRFDDGSALMYDRSTGAKSSTPWTPEGSPWVIPAYGGGPVFD